MGEKIDKLLAAFHSSESESYVAASRVVRTVQGAKLYGQPIGTVITADMEALKKKRESAFIITRIQSGGGDSPHFPADVARRFDITEVEAARLIAQVKRSGVPTIKPEPTKAREAKPEPTKERPSKIVQKVTPVVPVKETKVTSSNVVPVPVSVEGKDPLNRVEGADRDRVQRVLDEQRGFVPNTLRQFNGVRKMSATEAKEFESKFGNDALGGYTVETREIAIHPQVFTKKYEREFARDLKSGYISKCGHDHGSVESFVAHESGHHVDNVMRSATSPEVQKVWAALADSLELKPPFLTDKKSLDLWVSRNQAVLAKQVSRYGSESAAELIAEVWAEYTTNEKARSHIKTMGEAIRVLSEKNAKR